MMLRYFRTCHRHIPLTNSGVFSDRQHLPCTAIDLPTRLWCFVASIVNLSDASCVVSRFSSAFGRVCNLIHTVDCKPNYTYIVAWRIHGLVAECIDRDKGASFAYALSPCLAVSNY